MKKAGKAGQRKHGRGLRSPAHKRYNESGRWLKNKIRNITKALGAVAAEAWARNIGREKANRVREMAAARAKGY